MGQLLLVRHGQASWGADDYDVLSDTGWEQARVLGRALTARGVAPTMLVRGTMRRHRETVEGIADGLTLPEPVIDPGWDEFDSVDVFAPVAAPPLTGEDTASRAAFHTWFEAAMERWTGDEHASDYTESFQAFTDRVAGALRRTAQAAGSGTALVVTSGGAISWSLAMLLGDRLDARAQIELSRTINPLCANTGVSKIVSGRRGLTAVQFNEHTHLEPRPELITYR